MAWIEIGLTLNWSWINVGLMLDWCWVEVVQSLICLKIGNGCTNMGWITSPLIRFQLHVCFFNMEWPSFFSCPFHKMEPAVRFGTSIFLIINERCWKTGFFGFKHENNWSDLLSFKHVIEMFEFVKLYSNTNNNSIQTQTTTLFKHNQQLYSNTNNKPMQKSSCWIQSQSLI